MTNILFNQVGIDDNWCYDAFSTYIHAKDKVTIVPFSFGREQIQSAIEWELYYGKASGRYYSSIVDSFARYGIKEEQILWINYFDHTPEMTKNWLEESEIIYFPGGLPDMMMERIIAFDLVETIQKHSGLIMGFSAGAMIQLETYHITPDEDYDYFAYHHGLGLLNQFDIEVHFEHTPLQESSIKKAIDEKSKPVYAIEDMGALIVDNNQIRTVGNVFYYEGKSNKRTE